MQMQDLITDLRILSRLHEPECYNYARTTVNLKISNLNGRH